MYNSKHTTHHTTPHHTTDMRFFVFAGVVLAVALAASGVPVGEFYFVYGPLLSLCLVLVLRLRLVLVIVELLVLLP